MILLWSLLSMNIAAQVNRYSVPVQSTYVEQYVPLSNNEMMLMAVGKVAREARLEKQFEKLVQQAYDYLERGNNYWFIYYANQALGTGYYNVILYYDLGIVYYWEGERRKAKKFLTKAKRKGFHRAGVVLDLVKKKQIVDKSYLN